MFGDLDECSGGRCSAGEVSGTCTAGTCQPFLDAGAACLDDAGVNLDPGCAPGASCVGGACQKNGAVGDPCSAPGMLCRPTWPPIDCAPLADGGLACDNPRTAGGACDYQGAGVDEVCRSQVCGADGGCQDTLADGGVICGSEAPPCPAGSFCQPNPGDAPSCQPPRAGGAPCAPGDVCADGFTCALPGDGGAGTCVAVPDAGSLCDGPCAPPVPFGGACAADGDCETGLYCDDVTRTCLTWKRNGQPCSRDAECISATGCTGTVCASACTIP
jgi:hypothetical protein